jgi:hypothetical protein
VWLEVIALPWSLQKRPAQALFVKALSAMTSAFTRIVATRLRRDDTAPRQQLPF